MRHLPRRRALAALFAALLLLPVGFAVVVARPYSTPAVVIKWFLSSEEPNSTEVLLRMQLLARLKRYDWAVKIGDKWTQNNPDTFGWVNMAMVRICLFQAETDSKNVEEHARRALIYRDRALPFVSDSMSGLRDLSSLTTITGDLSPRHRCIQYGNAIKLLRGVEDLLKEENAQIQREIAPRREGDGLSAAQVAEAIQQNDSALNKVRDRQKHSGCSGAEVQEAEGPR